MNNVRANKQCVNIEDILALFAQLRTGKFSTQVTNADSCEVLKPIIDELNSLVQHFQAQAQSEKFLTLSLDLLCIAGPDSIFRKVNPAFMRVLGYSEFELISQPFLNFVHPEDVPKTLKEVERLAAGETTIYFENRYRAKNGYYRTFAWTASPDSETGYLYAIARDITELKQAEIETKLLSERLQEAELVSKFGFWELNLETYQGEWSKGLQALLGLKSLVNAPTFEMFIELVHPEDRIKVQAAFSRILDEKVRKFELEFRILVDNGKTTRWMKEHGKLELNSEGHPWRISGSIQDVTHLKLAEIELKELLRSLDSTAQVLERTSQMAKVGGWELNLSNGQVNLSKETQRIHEIDDNYVPPLYSNGSEWYPAESWPIVQAAVKAAIELRKPYDLETRFITAKGRSIWVRIQGFPVLVEEKVTHLVGTFQDITERKERELESKFVGDAMGFGTWKFDPVTKNLEWDDRMYTLFDVDPREFSGAYSAWENALSPKAREEAVKELELALRGEKDFNTEFEIALKNGALRHIAGRGIVIRNDKNEPIKMYGLNWDVTDRVMRELELKSANMRVIRTSKLASLGEMAAGIAHEINNPLAIVCGGIRALPKFASNPDQMSKKIEMIQAASERITRIV